jgi:hypothetical protein
VPAGPEENAFGLDVAVNEPTAVRAGVEERKDVGTLKTGDHPDLPLEPLDSHSRAEDVVQHLERDPTAVPEIVGEVHRRGGAPAEQRLDRVPVGESPRQRLDGVGYCGAASVGCGALRYFASQACTSA